MAETYNDHFEIRVDGELLNPTSEPQVHPGCNIVWPVGWTEDQANAWREANGMIKPEETEDDRT